MSKVACLNKTKAIRAENAALGLLLWPLLCCQPGQGDAAFLVSLGLWVWENPAGTTPREPLSYKLRGTFFPGSKFPFLFIYFLTDFLEGALLDRKGNLLKLLILLPILSPLEWASWLGHQKIKLFQRLFWADKIPNEALAPIITESLARQCRAKSDIQMRFLNAGRRLCVYNTSRSTWEFLEPFSAVFSPSVFWVTSAGVSLA